MTLEEAMAKINELTSEIQEYQTKEQGWQERETTLQSEVESYKEKYESQVAISSDLSKKVTSFVIPPKSEEPQVEEEKQEQPVSFDDLSFE